MHEQFDRPIDTVASKLPTAADHLESAHADALGFDFAKEIWRRFP